MPELIHWAVSLYKTYSTPVRAGTLLSVLECHLHKCLLSVVGGVMSCLQQLSRFCTERPVFHSCPFVLFFLSGATASAMKCSSNWCCSQGELCPPTAAPRFFRDDSDPVAPPTLSLTSVSFTSADEGVGCGHSRGLGTEVPVPGCHCPAWSA